MFQHVVLKQLQNIADGKFGLERENLRVTASGRLAMTPHPKTLGDKCCNPEITTDFSESQIEIVSPAVSSVEALLPEISRINAKVKKGLEDEYLWMQSVSPCHLPPEDKIPLAQFGVPGDVIYEKTEYRMYLAAKYGSYKQLYSGIHFNFSFDEDQLNELLSLEQRNDFYIRLMAQALKYRYFLTFTLAASPKTINGTTYRSARLGKEGYHNTQPILLDYSDTASYLCSLKKVIDSGVIEGSRELYELVRAKGTNMDEFNSLKAEINRIELRLPDLNPFYPDGINPADLYVMHLYIKWCSGLINDSYTDEEQLIASQLSFEASELDLTVAVEHKIKAIFDALFVYLENAGLPSIYHQSLLEAYDRFLYPKKRYAEKLLHAYSESSFEQFNLEHSIK